MKRLMACTFLTAIAFSGWHAAAPEASAVPIDQGLVFHVDAADPLGNGGTSLPGNGAPLPTWTNLGSYGPGANATAVSGSQPLWFSSGGAGGAPRINFDGSNDRMTAGTAADWKFLNYADNTTYLGSSVYVIYRTTDANPNTLLSLVSTGGVSSSTRGYDLFIDDRAAFGNERVRMILSKGAGSHVDITGASNLFPGQTWGLVTGNYGLGIAGPDATVRVNGAQVNSAETNNLPMVDGNPVNALNIGRISNNASFYNKGDYSEILIYNQYLTGVKRNLVENYLSAKYSGTTVTQELPIANDFYAGDTNANGDFDLNVFGIGRESDGVVATSVGGNGLNLAEANATLDVNGEYLLAGHKLPGQVSYVEGPENYLQWDRAWYLDATTAGSLEATLTFDFDDAGLTFDPLQDYYLLYAPNESTPYTVLGSTATLGLDSVSFNRLFNGSANDGLYTLGLFVTPIPEPASIWLLVCGICCWGCRKRRPQSQSGA